MGLSRLQKYKKGGDNSKLAVNYLLIRCGGRGGGGRELRIIQSHQAINIKDGNVRSIFSYVFLR